MVTPAVARTGIASSESTAIERRIGFIPGIITQEAMDTGTLNQSQRASGSPGNLLINVGLERVGQGYVHGTHDPRVVPMAKFGKIASGSLPRTHRMSHRGC